MRNYYKIKRHLTIALSSLFLFSLSLNVNAQLPFSDDFETGNFTSGGWDVSGNAEISDQSPAQGSYCVKGPGTYGIEKSFTNFNENIITVEFSMKASQTGSNCVVFGVFDENDYESAVVLFRHTGNIEAKDGPSGSTAIALMQYQSDTWYDMKIVMDFQNKTYDVFIDNILKADDFGFFEPSYGIPQSFNWRSGETWGTGWIDDVSISGSGNPSSLPFEDCFESSNFTSGGWDVSGNAEISDQSPAQGSYCVKGPGTYGIEKSFTNLNENIITVEFSMKASQTGSNCVVFGVFDENDYESAVVLFRHTGNIEAKDGPSGSTAIALMQYQSDTWYDMKIVMDFQNKTYDVFIDNILKADDFGFFEPSYGTPQSFNWRSGETWGTGWIDCVNIFAGTTGINDLELNNSKIQIYPNPTSDFLNFESELNQEFQVNIFNSQGQRVFVMNARNNKAINISKLSKGIYFVKLTDENGNIFSSEKVVKK